MKSIHISYVVDVVQTNLIAVFGGDVVVTIEADHIPDPHATTCPVDEV